ncbi:MAG: nuclear transport factor 2 family protein [Candidatus Saccharicenans sp.]|nr:nuclear transport factor 2 family protein [Candidatus Saccharicenans sp.]MDH7492517.1 hypothetical protein [Candidatus Saccharicenans sp.]
MSLLAALVFGLLSTVDSCRSVDESQIIKDLLARIVSLAEKKDRDRILAYLGPGYRDFEGRDVPETGQLLDHYFQNYQGIAIRLLDIYVDINNGQAEAGADVLLSSGPLEALRKIVGLVGVYYRFDFRLEKESGGWKIIYATWREIDSGSLLPGSQVILKKIFQDKS